MRTAMSLDEFAALVRHEPGEIASGLPWACSIRPARAGSTTSTCCG
jgi:hypothetical protein